MNNYMVYITKKDEEILYSKIDHCLISRFVWHIGSRGYALTYIDGNKISMHRLILNGQVNKKDAKTNPQEIDHINHNRSDNRRENLRVVNRSENKQNSKQLKTNTSGYRGVYYNKNQKIWIAQLGVRSKTRYLGRFITKEEAAIAYNVAAKEIYGEYAYLNKIEK